MIKVDGDMVNSAITVYVKIEGLSEFEELPVTLPSGSTLGDLFPALTRAYGEKVRPHLYNTLTGELGIFMVILNSELIRLSTQLSRLLKDGDRVFIISPIGGG